MLVASFLAPCEESFSFTLCMYGKKKEIFLLLFVCVCYGKKNENFLLLLCVCYGKEGICYHSTCVVWFLLCLMCYFCRPCIIIDCDSGVGSRPQEDLDTCYAQSARRTNRPMAHTHITSQQQFIVKTRTLLWICDFISPQPLLMEKDENDEVQVVSFRLFRVSFRSIRRLLCDDLFGPMGHVALCGRSGRKRFSTWSKKDDFNFSKFFYWMHRGNSTPFNPPFATRHPQIRLELLNLFKYV